MKAEVMPRQAAQQVRWERMHVSIRCGLHASQPTLIRIYLGLGRWLVRQGLRDDQRAHRRMLGLLLETARDESLPWFWRSVCLEHTAMPVARLTTLLKRQDPEALDALLTGLVSAQAQLGVAAQASTRREQSA